MRKKLIIITLFSVIMLTSCGKTNTTEESTTTPEPIVTIEPTEEPTPEPTTSPEPTSSVADSTKDEIDTSGIVIGGNGTGSYVEIETEADQLMSEIANQENTDSTGTGTSGTGTSGTTASPESTYQPPQLSEEEKAEMEAAGITVGNDAIRDRFNNATILDHSTAEDSGSGIGAGVKLK